MVINIRSLVLLRLACEHSYSLTDLFDIGNEANRKDIYEQDVSAFRSIFTQDEK
jgi:hypothetical protein